MKIIITEDQKKKLFIPRRISGEGSRWEIWNNEQPIKDGVRINQYTHDGIKIGYWEGYYSNGQLMYKGSYKDGKEEGYWEYYNDNGQLYSKGSFKNGERYGNWEKYYYNGQLWYKGSFKNWEREGYWEEYYPDGQLDSKGSYINGLRDGIWEYYYRSGELKYKSLYNDGKLVKIINESEEPKKGKLFVPRRISGENSRWEIWNNEQPIKDGIRINQYNIDTVKKEGYWEEYYRDGQLDSKGLYKNGLRDGIWEQYFPDGKLNYKGSYKNGIKEGIWEDYYNNGQLDSKGSYKNGLKEGYWEYYYSNGGLWFKGSYKNGKKEGIWERYYENGGLWFKGSFKNGKKIKTINESDGIIPILEMDIKKKDFLGKGSFHKVYPLKYDSNKVIKVPTTEYSKSEFDVSGSGSWFNIFMKYPKYFPIIYKVTNNYIILEKMYISKVKEDLVIMEDELVMLFPEIADKIEMDGYGVTEVLYEYIQKSVNGDKISDDKLKEIKRLVKNKKIFNKYIDLMVSIAKLRLRTFIDVNDDNFGYNNNGVLKMLDI